MDTLEQAEQLPAPDLFSWAESLARSRDPETSKQGAEGIQKQLGGMHHTFLRCLRELGQATSNEVAERCTSNFAKRNTYRRRASDLISDRFFGGPKIRIVGTRICKVSVLLESLEPIGLEPATNIGYASSSNSQTKESSRSTTKDL